MVCGRNTTKMRRKGTSLSHNLLVLLLILRSGFSFRLLCLPLDIFQEERLGLTLYITRQVPYILLLKNSARSIVTLPADFSPFSVTITKLYKHFHKPHLYLLFHKLISDRIEIHANFQFEHLIKLYDSVF